MNHSVDEVNEGKNPFNYHRPSPEGVEQITSVREACKALHDTLLTLPECRERSLAVTKLEEVSMWANKAIVMQDPGAVAVSTAAERAGYGKGRR